LFFNVWCLLSLGALAERILDPKTYLLIYSLCGLAGSCVSVWWHPKMVGAGASGAIFGLAGAVLAALYLGNFPFRKEAIRPILKSLLSFAGWNLFLGLRAGVTIRLMWAGY
jgi:rhomboid protease GluP